MTGRAWELSCRHADCESIGYTLAATGVEGALFKRQLTRRCPECGRQGEGTRTLRVVDVDELPEDARSFLQATADENHGWQPL